MEFEVRHALNSNEKVLKCNSCGAVGHAKGATRRTRTLSNGRECGGSLSWVNPRSR